MSKRTWTLLPVVALLSACNSPGAPGGDAVAKSSPTATPTAPAAPAAVTAEERAVAEGSNAFGAELFVELAKKEKGNVFFSPNSIEVALAMTLAGARGSTETEMAKVLHLPADPKATQAGFRALLNRLNGGAAGSRQYILRAANAIWMQKGSALRPDFLTIVSTSFGGAARELDFAQTEPSRLEINGWVEDRTEKRIQDLLPKGTITIETRLVLTNAIYFKGKWADEFDPKLTKEDVFHAPSGDVKASFMNATRHVAYSEEDGVQVVELPYLGNELAMVVMLPADAKGLAALEATLGDRLAKAPARRPREIAVTLPRFKMTLPLALADPLQKLGMKSAFGSGADFSAMTGDKGFSISDVLHKAFVEVNEEGTEAAAATAVVMRVTSVEPPPLPFRADRPFVFLIRENATGAILFMGRVTDP